MGDFVIKVENVSKTFRLPHEKSSSIKSMAVNFYKHKKGYELQKALNEVSFEIKKGEFFGIVGKNGSGKSTLLKLLAGIYTPTSGEVHIRGSLTPFIELGVGFNPELTGRENVFLNGALLGFNRKEVNAMYQSIVDFAEIEKFMDQKLKNYSSGMQVRLAFSIAIRAKSNILLLDEVLAVGDAAFQQKCLDIFEQYKAEKQTVILVTHDMETVRRFCTRALLIDNGNVLDCGEPNQIATKYSRINREVISDEMDKKKVKDSPIKVKLEDESSNTSKSFKTGEKMTVKLSWPAELKDVHNVGVAIVKNSGEFMFGANTLGQKVDIKSKATYKVELSLAPGKYYIMAGLFGEKRDQVIEFLDKGPELLIIENEKDSSDGAVRLEHEWIT